MIPAPAVPIPVLAVAAIAGLVAGVPLALEAERWLRRRPLRRAPLLVAGPVAAAALAVVVVLRLGQSVLLVPYLLLAAGAVVLALVDAIDRRLPNLLNLLVGGFFLIAVAVAEALVGRLVPLAWGLVGALALLAVYLLLALPFRGAIGMGDVKLAPVIGLACGLLGFRVWLVGLAAPFLVNAVVVLVALLLRRTSLKSSFPFGPAMVAGLAVALLTA